MICYFLFFCSWLGKFILSDSLLRIYVGMLVEFYDIQGGKVLIFYIFGSFISLFILGENQKITNHILIIGNYLGGGEIHENPNR